MVYDPFMTPGEHLGEIAKRAKEKRLSLNLSQKTLSERSGVSFGVLKKFELEGKISLKSLLKLAAALDSLDDFLHLFKAKGEKLPLTLDDLIKENTRKRGRQ